MSKFEIKPKEVPDLVELPNPSEATSEESKTLVLPKRHKGVRLTVEAIRQAGIEHFKKTGYWPFAHTTDPVPGMPGEKWKNIDSAGRKGLRGLEKGQTLKEIFKPLKNECGSKIIGGPLAVAEIRQAWLRRKLIS
jgi:hypothetical protein